MFNPSVLPAKPVARWARVVIGVFLLLTCIRAWVGQGTTASRAYAQIPDSGMQRKVLIDEIRKTNQLITQLAATMKTHTFKVRIEGTDKQATTKRSVGRK